MNEGWKLLVSFIIGVALSSAVWYFFNPSVDVTPYQETISKLKDTVQYQQNYISRLIAEKERINDSIANMKKGYFKRFSRTISVTKADSLRNKVIEKGRKRYDTPSAPQHPTVESPMYGNMALDELALTDNRERVNKKIIAEQRGVVLVQGEIITTQEKLNIAVNKNVKNKKILTFLQGGFVGFLLSLLLLL